MSVIQTRFIIVYWVFLFILSCEWGMSRLIAATGYLDNTTLVVDETVSNTGLYHNAQQTGVNQATPQRSLDIRQTGASGTLVPLALTSDRAWTDPGEKLMIDFTTGSTIETDPTTWVSFGVENSAADGAEKNMIFETGGLERMRISHNGNWSVGTVSMNHVLTVTRPDDEVTELSIRGETSQGSGVLFLGQATSYGAGFLYNGDDAPDMLGTQDQIHFFRRNSESLPRDHTVFSYNYNGNTVSFTSTIDNGSDRRFKKDIVPLTDASLAVASVQGVVFRWNQAQFPDKGFSSGPQIGFIAQDMLARFPELVSEDPNGFYYVAYAPFTAVLTQVVKENYQRWQHLDNEAISDLEQAENSDRLLQDMAGRAARLLEGTQATP